MCRQDGINGHVERRDDYEIHSHSGDFYGLIAGPIGTARELVADCLRELDREPEVANVSDVLTRVKRGIGVYKRRFADTHCRARLGISYSAFRKDGSTSFPEDVYREVAWEIKHHYSGAELIVSGFVNKSPIIIKVSNDSVWECDDFAAIGSGATIAEASLFHRDSAS